MNSKLISLQKFHKELFAQKGEEIFRSIEDQLKPEHIGKVIAIEIESGDYFIGRTHSEAGDKAKRRYSDKIFYFARVGARAGVSFRANYVMLKFG